MPESNDDLERNVQRAVEADESLRDFAKPFKLKGAGRSSPDGLARHLKGKKLVGSVQLSLRSGRSVNRTALVLTPLNVELADGGLDDPALEIITDEATWDELTAGRLTPLGAFCDGRLRVRGDLGLARRLASLLS